MVISVNFLDVNKYFAVYLDIPSLKYFRRTSQVEEVSLSFHISLVIYCTYVYKLNGYVKYRVQSCSIDKKTPPLC